MMRIERQTRLAGYGFLLAYGIAFFQPAATIAAILALLEIVRHFLEDAEAAWRRAGKLGFAKVAKDIERIVAVGAGATVCAVIVLMAFL